MRRMRSATALGAALIVSYLVMMPHAGISKPAGIPITFSHGSLLDVQRLGAEPQVHIDSKGNVYTAAPIGVQYATSFFWKSEDQGDSFDLLRAFPPLQRPAPSGGSGDTDFAITAPAAGSHDDAVVWTDMVALADIATAATFDGGNTFPPDYWNDLAGTSPGADRQWNTSVRLPGTTTNRVYTFWDAYPAVGLSVMYTDDYGKTWQAGQSGITSGPNPGNIVADPVHRKLYATWGNGSNVVVASSGLDAQSFAPVTVASGSGTVATLFTVVDVDTAGNVYVVWADQGGDRGVYLSVSKDQGATWSPKVKVSSADLSANVFPWVAAGDPGRIWVTWYGSKAAGDAPSNRGPWDVYAAQSLNALGTAPTFTQVKVNEHPIHDNEICLSGIGCTAGQAEDRNMLDDFTSDIDPRGMLHLTYNDTNNQVGQSSDPDAGGAYIIHARQLSGPSLYTRVGTVVPAPAKPKINSVKVSGKLTAKGTHTLRPGNWSVDPAGDAGDPRHGPGCPCPNNPALDLTASGLQANKDGSLTAFLQVNDLPATPADAVVAAGGKTVLYQSFFWVNGKALFAAVETTGTGAAYAGSPGFVPNQAGIAKIATYQPDPSRTTTTTFTWKPGKNGRIEIVIPASVVGTLSPGAAFNQVTGLVQTFSGSLGAETLMDERDATPPATWNLKDPLKPDGTVQLSIDDPSFRHPVQARLTPYPGSAWSATLSLSGLKLGNHKLYARQVENGFAGPPAVASFRFG